MRVGARGLLWAYTIGVYHCGGVAAESRDGPEPPPPAGRASSIRRPGAHTHARMPGKLC